VDRAVNRKMGDRKMAMASRTSSIFLSAIFLSHFLYSLPNFLFRQFHFRENIIPPANIPSADLALAASAVDRETKHLAELQLWREICLSDLAQCRARKQAVEPVANRLLTRAVLFE